MSGKAAKLLISSSEHNADMLYVAGVFVPDPFIVAEVDGQWHGLLSTLEIDRARKKSCLHHVHLDSPWRKQAEERGWQSGLAFTAAAFLASHGIGRVQVPADFPLLFAEQLRGLGFTVTAGDGSLFPQRAIKTEAEIAQLQRAVRICKSAMRMAERTLASASIDAAGILRDAGSGRRMKSADLRRVIDTEIIARGATPSHTIVACGREAADPHNIGHGFLRAGQSIIIDIFPRHHSGYWGDMTRTFVKGKADRKIRRMYQAVRQGQDLGLSMLADGADGAAIHAAILAFFEKKGFPTGERRGRQMGFFHGTGHGVGLDIHEQPRVSIKGDKLRAGHVVTVEPGLYYHDVGGVRLEDMAVVTGNGHRNLTRYPRRMEIA